MSFFSKKSSQRFNLKAFFKAIESGNYKTAKLELGEHPYAIYVKNSDNLFPLNVAAKNGHLNIVKMLVENGAEVYRFRASERKK